MGGLAAGYGGLHDLSTLQRQTSISSAPVAPTRVAARTLAPTAATPAALVPTAVADGVVATVPAVATRLALRDFDQHPPPFAAAGATDSPTANGQTGAAAPPPTPRAAVTSWSADDPAHGD